MKERNGRLTCRIVSTTGKFCCRWDFVNYLFTITTDKKFVRCRNFLHLSLCFSYSRNVNFMKGFQLFPRVSQDNTSSSRDLSLIYVLVFFFALCSHRTLRAGNPVKEMKQPVRAPTLNRRLDHRPTLGSMGPQLRKVRK